MARFFCIFHGLSFELNFFFDQRFPLKQHKLGRIFANFLSQIFIQITLNKLFLTHCPVIDKLFNP